MRVFLLNGPPGIGKDTLAAGIERVLEFPTLMFKAALYAETAKYFRVSTNYLTNVATAREFKERPNKYLDGFSPRGALIHVSESIIKPHFGKQFFGLKAVEALKQLDGRATSVVFSDSGFIEETECLVEHGFEVHIIRMHHPSFNFDNDSRDYLHNIKGTKEWSLNVTMGEPLTDLHKFTYILENIEQ